MNMRLPARHAAFRAAFTLIEIMIAVMIVGLLMMIAVPNMRKYMETGRYNAIVANLKAIELAKTTWANDNRKPDNAVPTEADLAPYFQGEKFPASISGETYNINAVTERPTALTQSRLRNIEAGGLVTIPDR
jgi:prepilin-type N-terminal cleavage/methylation domain-containing protein